MKTFDLKRSDREKKAERERWMEPMPMMGGGDYHHGLQFSLDDATLKKVLPGLKTLPADGTRYNLEGGAHVIGSNSDSDMGNANRSLRLVIHTLGMEPAEAEAPEKEKSIREELEDARGQAGGTTARAGRIGARVDNGC